ncbi:alpha/beta fold hydrolase [Citricoccus sp.]|uniref:alpha/beta fold hydrolase n=1 Tax=Citricoccus sp. TaxID=1978372 RepID=UPI00262F2F41|nr:alpha/beta fold hydrolase [Citricoccus sp.]HRO30061.1 alpha/beta fold hydrolase [Citricoccus sp.]HRO94550.1 alpha/beta fold hydrolase [Citricoccus sp.]
MAERMIQAGGVELCTEAFGDRADPPLLLVMGLGASMLWWDEGFCRLLADGGRFVIRYDHRDTGRSAAYPPGHPGYTGQDLVDDAVGVLDAYGLPAAHVVGLSAGGGLAQLLALDHPARVLSLVLISTSPAVPGERRLPPPTRDVLDFASTVDVDWSDPASVADYLVGYERMLTGPDRPVDVAAVKGLVARDVARSRDIRTIQNHDLLEDEERPLGPLSSITAPTLVIHGGADPLFPPAHGRALAEEIPEARLLLLEAAGHGLQRTDWQIVARSILEHTAADR